MQAYESRGSTPRALSPGFAFQLRTLPTTKDKQELSCPGGHLLPGLGSAWVQTAATPRGAGFGAGDSGT